ncbi:hypothetical protein [Spirosoma telluris]|uniref:hypothetical protein n=1 Tax=Spirosoma telluris TaxID=2183553 RepID=UPI002FC3A5B9
MEKETKEERIARRHRERDEQMKSSPGYVTFSIMFTLAYPFIAVFTFIMSTLLAVFSGFHGRWRGLLVVDVVNDESERLFFLKRFFRYEGRSVQSAFIY